MQKRKLSMSVIILFIAAVTLVSGTYAWFMVGGFASLFSLDYNVTTAGAGIEVRGSAGTAYDAKDGNKVTWGQYLAYDNFTAGEIIPDDGTGFYTPVSPAQLGTSASFVKVGLEGRSFSAAAATKGTHYNDFSLDIRSAKAEPVNVEMKVKISGTALDGGDNPTQAGRVAVTYDDKTTVYALSDDSDSYVTQIFSNGAITDTDANEIITSADNGYEAAGLTGGTVLLLDENGNVGSTGAGIMLNDVPGNTSSKKVYIQTWLEGNDPDCIDVTQGTGANANLSIAGGQFVINISFATVD